MHENNMGTLYVVATPIGNLQDITLRAIETLKTVDKIAAEDTRHAKGLLKHFSINKPTISLHEFNERECLDLLLEHLSDGESIALISDAGTPLISDPGYHLIKEAKARGFTVVPVPGACAGIAALSVAGLPSDRFIFEGFLPAKQEACRNRLKELLYEPRTLIFYEAPHRLMDALQVMVEVFGGERTAVVARELTKIYESVMNASLAELLAWYETHPDQQRGEIVILVRGADHKPGENVLIDPEYVLDSLLSELPLKQAVAMAAKITGERKNELYEKALARRSSSS
jgi:16S rRNA (cytidine1402-2'-O)-methyltransferase